ncbi:protein tyrosine phosphatase family protein [Rubrivivax rivuli]|uniref:Phosphatase n=1 Tax=Rubrivivax rivuli TaxID=1862385 RepID=A0A437R7Y7_9BURK|nr:protein tyrosine phosphatase family protein [Rubrivivax rivuli]RVU42843.1 hypothetical protein EOE66_21575 [Rubrivivax rivuli]
MVTTRRLTLLAGLTLVSRAHAAGIGFSAPNIVAITPQLVTSGQPSGPALESLGALGFQAVVYLAPSSVPDAIKNEPEILASQGIEFVHIPIPFGAPEPSHADAVSLALQRLQAKKVLVHCQVNMRASSMVFLHRVLHRKENPALAYEAVAKVWSPSGAWRTLLVHQLAKYKVNFEPY